MIEESTLSYRDFYMSRKRSLISLIKSCSTIDALGTLPGLTEELHNEPREPTALSLTESLVGPLSARVVAPCVVSPHDVELKVVHPWCFPFRLVRVALRQRTDIGFAVEYLISNTTAEATLECPCEASPLSGMSTWVLSKTLRTLMRCESAPSKSDARVLLVEIPVPTGITLRSGTVIFLLVCIAGAPFALRIPPAGHVHSAICNHRREAKWPLGPVWMAARGGNTAALEAALAAGGSTEETNLVRRRTSPEHAAGESCYIRAVRRKRAYICCTQRPRRGRPHPLGGGRRSTCNRAGVFSLRIRTAV